MNTLILIASLIVGMTATSAYSAERTVSGSDKGLEYATVIETTPVFRSVRVTAPRQECDGAALTDQGSTVPAEQLSSAFSGSRLFVAGGSGRIDAAEVAAGGEPCRTVMDIHYEERVDGYDVTYRYNGQIYQTRMPYDPGRRVPVRVDSRLSRD